MHQFSGGLGHRLDPVSGVVAVGGDCIGVLSEYWRCRAVDNSMSIYAGSWILISTMPDSRASSGILATLNRESPNSSAIWTLVRPSR